MQNRVRKGVQEGESEEVRGAVWRTYRLRPPSGYGGGGGLAIRDWTLSYRLGVKIRRGLMHGACVNKLQGGIQTRHACRGHGQANLRFQ